MIAQFKDIFQGAPTIRAMAPGRVNLIGGHTDYNEGFVMPIAIQHNVSILAQPRRDNEIHLHSTNFDQTDSFSLTEKIVQIEDKPWSNYIRGVTYGLQQAGWPIQGANLFIESDVPIGAGLASSAAVEMATCIAYQALFDLDTSTMEMIEISLEAENRFVGKNCGPMDQFISALGQPGKALFLDCRNFVYELVSFPSDHYSVVIMNTKVRKGEVIKEYNERRAACREGVRLLKEYFPDIRALRDVGSEQFEKVRHHLPELIEKRCAHIIFENERVQMFAKALKDENTSLIGQLINASHKSLKENYEVSCPELNAMVDIALEVDGVIGARMTGAGFGGCAIAVVSKGIENDLKKTVMKKFAETIGHEPEVYMSEASDGARYEILG